MFLGLLSLLLQTPHTAIAVARVMAPADFLLATFANAHLSLSLYPAAATADYTRPQSILLNEAATTESGTPTPPRRRVLLECSEGA